MSTRLVGLAVSLIVVLAGCGIPTDDSPESVDIPSDVYPDDLTTPNQPDANEPNVTLHPVYFVRDGYLVGIDRPLPKPVYLDAPLENLIAGLTDQELAAGLETFIPAGTEIGPVFLDDANVVSVHLNDAFNQVEGEQRIRATAQLVFTGYGLATDTQGVQFFLNGEPFVLPAGDGTVEELSEGGRATPLTLDDFIELVPVPAGPEIPAGLPLTSSR